MIAVQKNGLNRIQIQINKTEQHEMANEWHNAKFPIGKKRHFRVWLVQTNINSLKFNHESTKLMFVDRN